MYISIYVVATLLVLVLGFYFWKKHAQKLKKPRQDPNRWVNTDNFTVWQKNISHNCNDDSLREYILFLKNYKGGYIRRKKGEIVQQRYLPNELGALKGIFLNVVCPSPKPLTETKEEFRELLVKLGVRGVDVRPRYEERAGKLRVRASLSDAEKRIKRAGNYGEQLVRDALQNLAPEYKVVSGIRISVVGQPDTEFDHVVVGPSGVFVIETKAFGLSHEGKANRCIIFITQDDKWSKLEHGFTSALTSPTAQIIRQREVAKTALSEFGVRPRAVLVLANPKAVIAKNAAKQKFMILTANKLPLFIQKNRANQENLSPEVCEKILEKLDSVRVN